MSFFGSAKNAFDSFSSHVKDEIDKIQGDGQSSAQTQSNTSNTSNVGQSQSAGGNRFDSFAPPRAGNEAKWYVDGCGYMWAVSVAIEEARESIWILDWWLSGELYLRRPPTENENYRVDRMLLAAAERGVKVNVIIYKEVSQILTLCSDHTKKALQLHPNIAVFRHPDHTPSGPVIQSELLASIQNFSLKSLQLADIPADAFKALYGVNKDVVLYWAHHEKLCLVDGDIAFMGGLDLCFGRWDTNSHPLADAHPTNINKALFPGQDFNNARVFDFEDVTNWEKNKLDRTKNSRMGWSDISICLRGPVVQDLKAHFVQRWDFIYEEKYRVRKDPRFESLRFDANGVPGGYYRENGSNSISVSAPRSLQIEGISDSVERGFGQQGGQHEHRFHLPGGHGSIFDRLRGTDVDNTGRSYSDTVSSGISIQLVRSCTQWSNGVAKEHSIANAYIDIIRNSEHFVYIENQFFITATGDKQRPVKNQIGAAIVERIVRAYREGQRYKVIVCMPAVPAFAGDLHADDSLGTRAIMEYQYHSICRGGHSIMEEIEKAGVPDSKQYIRFYNLRNYDRINAGSAMARVYDASGIEYEDARREHDDIVGAGYNGRGEGTGAYYGRSNPAYEQYQEAGALVNDDSKYDSVAACSMDYGPSIKDIPWSGSEEAEFNAYVSEELYIHSKVLIADDKIVICGSANLNDRSQLGDHDSEIAVVIQDPTPVDSEMNHAPYQASRFASSLRRQLFRKHLGLLPHQDPTRPDENFLPISHAPNTYDWGSPADILVRDVLSDEFNELWTRTAAVNTEIFTRAFHVVPADNVRNWEDYKEFFSKHFMSPSKEEDKVKLPSRYEYGHVVKEEFPGGVAELKDNLNRVRGSLVEMPLLFMDGVDFAKEGLTLNALTDEVYT
ncbi:related to phospholipase D [Rhynchosporium graminicola]|uniref:Phospholipase n=1 Tax=Rhynchosporium graminicola TaxID=2792576 RepID=A0A1E1LMG9_9HELO|nr:related to phospholipase D [Rhynchosporium commune]